MKKQPLLNTCVNNTTMDETLEYIDELIVREHPAYIMAVNVDVIMKIEKDAELKQVADDADMVIVDGKPLIWISKWHKKPIKEKISGSDLVPALCSRSAQKGYSIFILGGKEGVAEQAKLNLQKKYEGINIIGTYAPPYGFEKNQEEIDKINSMLNEAKPDILVVCFGCPKQEKFVYDNYQKYGAKVSVCAGATVDFLAGNVKRAPRWMSEHGLEWLYRFIQEPKRLFKRYFVDDIKILKLVWKYRK